jgi:hypothetical protein
MGIPLSQHMLKYLSISASGPYLVDLSWVERNSFGVRRILVNMG